jgi:hypothetical protein
MKTTHNFLKFLFLFTSFAFLSCEYEPLDNGLNPDSSGGNNGGGSGGGGTSTGDYWPTAINNVWNFSTDGDPAEPMKIIGTSSMNGSTYYNFDSVLGQNDGLSANAEVKIKKNNGDYYLYLKTEDISAGGITISQTPAEYIFLKDYLAVNATWNGTYTQTTTYNIAGVPPINTTTNYTGTILGKDLTETVNGQTYTNVIKCKVLQQISFSGQTSNVETTYWFAKNIGPIKAQTVSNGETLTSILTSYTLF